MEQFNLLVKYLSPCELAYMGILTPHTSRSNFGGEKSIPCPGLFYGGISVVWTL